MAARHTIVPGGVLVLASASPRRAQLLRDAGITFDVQPADVDETVRAGETPQSYVRRVAQAKARKAAEGLDGRVVLAADTIVVVDDEILGKPRDAEDAKRMLRRLSGRTHEVLTAVCLLAPQAPVESCEVCATMVEFASLTAADIDWYVTTGEPFDKAGAYAIQGLASRFVERIEGSYSNVVGLPVSLFCRMCKDAGILIS